MVHSSSVRQEQNTAQNDARRHIKGLKRRLKVMAKITKEQWEKRINEAGDGRYGFIQWAVDGEFGALKKCVVRCVKDGFKWSATSDNLVNGGYGCPQCSGVRRWTAEERIDQINCIENIEFVSWVEGYKKHNSKANVRCDIDGYEWCASVNSLINNGSGCPRCLGRRIWTAEERIEQINSLENIEFISWVDSYKSKDSKANLRCSKDAFVWESRVDSIVNKGSGCPQCAGNRRWTGKERIEQINNIKNIEFISWVDGYRKHNSKANIRCKVDGFEWSASVSSIVNNGTGCPKCAKYGYDQSKTGTLYALRSECGQYVKVGISNKPKRRHKELERRTPFKFNLVEQIYGDGLKISELEKHFHDKHELAGFTGFDGCTEWLICTPQLLKELRELEDVK